MAIQKLDVLFAIDRGGVVGPDGATHAGNLDLNATARIRFADGTVPAKREIQRRFRTLLRDAHPDHGGESTDAAQRIADLAEARDILLA